MKKLLFLGLFLFSYSKIYSSENTLSSTLNPNQTQKSSVIPENISTMVITSALSFTTSFAAEKLMHQTFKLSQINKNPTPADIILYTAFGAGCFETIRSFANKQNQSAQECLIVTGIIAGIHLGYRITKG